MQVKHLDVERAKTKLQMLGMTIISCNKFAIKYQKQDGTIHILVVKSNARTSDNIDNIEQFLLEQVVLLDNFLIYQDNKQDIYAYTVGERERIQLNPFEAHWYGIWLAQHSFKLGDVSNNILNILPRLQSDTDEIFDLGLTLLSKSGKLLQIRNAPRRLFIWNGQEGKISLRLNCIYNTESNSKDEYLIGYTYQVYGDKHGMHLKLPVFKFTGDFDNITRFSLDESTELLNDTITSSNIELQLSSDTVMDRYSSVLEEIRVNIIG